MPWGRTFAGELAAHIFDNANIANVGDATGLRGSSTAGNLYLSAHTGDPGATGTQETSECAYTGYDRVAVPRDGSLGTISEDTLTLDADIPFPEASAGSETITHVAFGTAASGAGKQIIRGAISPTIAVAAGVTPILKAGTTIELKDVA